MITDDVCEGCGIPLQSEQPDGPGYVPVNVARRSDSVVCRRCFRINNYGKEDEGIRPDGERAWSTVMDVLATVPVAITVVDVLDFEGSFIPSLVEAAAGKTLVAANKIDLLPTKTPVEEVVSWIETRLKERGLSHGGVFSISARSGYGVRVLLEAARKQAGREGVIGLVGATNVGKSTLVNRWLKGSDDDGPTISRFPGTTLGVVERSIDGMNLDLLDTPGLDTQGRATDMLCQTCATRLVPESPIRSKLLRMGPGESLVLGGLAAFTPSETSDGEHMVLAFAAADVPIQKVKNDRVAAGLAGQVRGVERLLCSTCRSNLDRVGWEQVTLHADEMEDVAIHGLGWISPRRKGMHVQVTLPAGVMASLRPRLIGPKTPARKRKIYVKR